MLVSTSNVTTSVHATAAAPSSVVNNAAELCVIADSEAGLALACLVSQETSKISVLTSLPSSSIPHEFETRMRRATVSNFRGLPGFSGIMSDAGPIGKQASAVIIGSPVTEYGAIAQRLAPHLRHGQTVCLVNAALGAGLQFVHQLKLCGSQVQLNVLETGAVFDCAKLEGRVLLVIGPREKVSFCGNSRNETRRGLSVASALSKGLVPSSNVIERGLSDVERILRPALLLVGIIGGKQESLDNIATLLNPSLLSIAAGLDSEVQQLAKVFKCVVPSFSQALRDFAMCQQSREQCSGHGLETLLFHLGQGLVEQSHTESLSLSSAKQLLRRDVLETLTLLSDMARLSRMPVPIINSIIELAGVVLETDLSKQGRTVADLGLVGFDLEEIVELINS